MNSEQEGCGCFLIFVVFIAFIAFTTWQDAKDARSAPVKNIRLEHITRVIDEGNGSLSFYVRDKDYSKSSHALSYTWYEPEKTRIVEDVPENKDSWAEIINYGRRSAYLDKFAADYPIVHVHKLNVEVTPVFIKYGKSPGHYRSCKVIE